jgi:hypothetical protein
MCVFLASTFFIKKKKKKGNVAFWRLNITKNLKTKETAIEAMAVQQ